MGPAVDVAIGLMLVYLLLSLVVTAVQEIIASALKLRGKALRAAVADLLTNGNRASPLFQRVFGHALISGIAVNDTPSYIPAKNFTLALIDTITQGSQAPVFSELQAKISTLPEGPVRQALDAYLRDAAGDLTVLQSSVADWFDAAMDRLSGQYKRLTQSITLACGLALAVGLNVDSARIAMALWQNEALRASMVSTAQQVVRSESESQPKESESGPAPDHTPPGAAYRGADTAKTGPAPPTSSPNSSQPNSAATANVTAVKQLMDLGLPIGWPAPKASLTCWGVVLMVFGWLMTAVAVSLGSHFWFGTLQSFLNLRSSGPKPEKASTQRKAQGV